MRWSLLRKLDLWAWPVQFFHGNWSQHRTAVRPSLPPKPVESVLQGLTTCWMMSLPMQCLDEKVTDVQSRFSDVPIENLMFMFELLRIVTGKESGLGVCKFHYQCHNWTALLHRLIRCSFFPLQINPKNMYIWYVKSHWHPINLHEHPINLPFAADQNIDGLFAWWG